MSGALVKITGIPQGQRQRNRGYWDLVREAPERAPEEPPCRIRDKGVC